MYLGKEHIMESQKENCNSRKENCNNKKENDELKITIIKGIVAIITAIVGVTTGIIIWNSTKIVDSTITYNNAENAVRGDAYIDNSTNITYKTEYIQNEELDIMDRAKIACQEGDFDTAFDLYKEREAKDALINMGYIYAYGYSYMGEDIQKAEEYYIKANCVEAKRNLLILYIENEMDEKVKKLCAELLWSIDDAITWDYISNCLYKKSWDSYQEEMGITKEDFSFNINQLYEWEYSDSYYRGENPPSDTTRKRWIIQGIDFESGEGYNHSYSVYRAQVRSYAIGIENMESLYFENEGKLYMLK